MYFNWKDFLKEYIANSNIYWKGNSRQNNKLAVIKGNIIAKNNFKENEYFDYLINLFENRSEKNNKLYISNIGGSGSHWLSTMIQEFPNWYDVGEVYLPNEFYHRMINLDNYDQVAKFYDSIELLHGFLYNLDSKNIESAKIINSAHGVEKIIFHKTLFPHSKVIHLYRDPRDRVLSVTYRKNEWRHHAHPNKNDEEYLIFNSKRVESGFKRYINQKEKADLELKYESLKNNTSMVLNKINLILNEKIPINDINKIANKFNAKHLLNNNEIQGNLYIENGKLSSNWQNHNSEKDLRIMHSIMNKAIMGLQYEIGDCFGFKSKKYNYNINLSIGKRTLIKKYIENFSVYYDDRWKVMNDELLHNGKISNLRLVCSHLNSKIIIKLVNQLQLSHICLNNIDEEVFFEVVNKLKQISIPYIDLSQNKYITKKMLNVFPNVKLINLSGCDIKSISKEFSSRVIIDF